MFANQHTSSSRRKPGFAQVWAPTLAGVTIVGLCLFLTSCSKQFGPYLEKAQKAYEKGNYTEAIDYSQAALPLWSDSDGQESRAQAYQILGLSYNKIRKIDKAIEAYNEAVNLSNSVYQSAYNLGNIYLASNQPKLAIRVFKRALRMKKDDPLSHLGIGNARYELKQYKMARINYKKILEVSPGVQEAIEHIRLVDQKLKKKKKRIKKRRRR